MMKSHFDVGININAALSLFLPFKKDRHRKATVFFLQSVIILPVRLPGLQSCLLILPSGAAVQRAERRPSKRRLRAAAETANIPVNMLTARRGERDVVSALSLGANDFLAKPFLPEELALRVKSLLEKART